eukprot:1458769-Rhodomonas_salina.3
MANLRSLPTTYSYGSRSYLTWETTGCGTFAFEAETVMVTLDVFSPGTDMSEYPSVALGLCSGEFRPTVNPEFLHHLPCICRSEFVRVDASGIVVDRVVPKKLACPKGSYLRSPGLPITGQRVADNSCVTCPPRKGLCANGYHSTLCWGGFEYLDTRLYDISRDTIYSFDRQTVKLHVRPSRCEVKCNVSTLGQFEYFSGQQGSGDCTRGVCSSCDAETAVKHSGVSGYTEAFYADKCAGVTSSSLQCRTCWGLLSSFSLSVNPHAILFENAVNFRPVGVTGYECPWMCKVGYKRLRSTSTVLNQTGLYQCIPCAALVASNVSACEPGFHVTGCADLLSDSLVPICGKCRVPAMYEVLDMSGVSWKWKLEATGLECTHDCQEGYFPCVSGVTSGACTPCPEGSMCSGGDSGPVVCAPGQWTAGVAQNVCGACPANHYCGNSTGRHCGGVASIECWRWRK